MSEDVHIRYRNVNIFMQSIIILINYIIFIKYINIYIDIVNI
jgi:hypothetical protein